MGERAENHEEVPDLVETETARQGIGLLGGEDGSADRVEYAPEEDEADTRPGDDPVDGPGGHCPEPSHRRVKRHRDPPGKARIHGLEGDARDGDGPAHTEEGPAQGAAQDHEADRRESARDEQVDGEVVHGAEELLPPRGGHDAVMEGGGEQDRKERETIDREAHDVPRLARHAGVDDEKDGAEEREDGRGHVRGRVEPLVGDVAAVVLAGLAPGHCLMLSTSFNVRVKEKRKEECVEARRVCYEGALSCIFMPRLKYEKVDEY